jgi:hypothetical protein
VKIVKRNPLDRWNQDSTGYRFDVLSEITPLSVTFEPFDGHVGDQAGELMVVYREAHLHFSLVSHLADQWKFVVFIKPIYYVYQNDIVFFFGA